MIAYMIQRIDRSLASLGESGGVAITKSLRIANRRYPILNVVTNKPVMGLDGQLQVTYDIDVGNGKRRRLQFYRGVWWEKDTRARTQDIAVEESVNEMAATYVPITREEFESWLTEVWGAGNWNIRSGTVGVYRLKLGRKVSIEVSSSIGRADTNMGVGEGAIHVAMVGRVTGRTLNKKAVGKSRINRTKGWKGNLLAAVKAVEAEYNLRPNFYEAIADPEAYRDETLSRIEAVPGGSQSDFWRSLHDWVSSGKILSDKQTETLRRQTPDFTAKTRV